MNTLSFLNESNINSTTNIHLVRVFNKLDVYSRNKNLATLNESQYGRYNRNIRLNIEEQSAVKQLFRLMEEAAAESIINEYNLEYEYETLNEGIVIDKFKSLKDKGKEKFKNLSDKAKEGVRKLGALKEFFNTLMKKAVDSIEKLLQLLLEIFTKLGDTLSDAIKRLLGGSMKAADDEETMSMPDNEVTSDIPQEDKGFLALVYDYVSHRVSDSKTMKTLKGNMSDNAQGSLSESVRFPRPQLYEAVLINEWNPFKKKKADPQEVSEPEAEADSFDIEPEDREYKNKFDKFVHTNKAFQWIVGYRPGKGKIKWWKSLLASIVGSIIVTLIIPAILTVTFGSGPIVLGICFGIKIIWATKGVCRVLLSRYTSKGPGEKFWNTSTAIAFIIACAFFIIPRIPAVQQWMADGIKHFFEWTGLDKAVNNAEDWLRSLCGAAKTEKDVVVRYEKIQDHLQKYVPRHGGGGHISREMQGISSRASDAIETIKNSKTIPADMKAPLQKFTDMINQQHFSSSHAMNQFMQGRLTGCKNAVYSFDLSRFKSAHGFEGKSARWLANYVKDKLEEKGIHGTVINALNDEMRDSTGKIAGANAMFVTDIPVEQGLDFETVFQDIAKEAGVAGSARSAFGHLLNDLNDTIAVETVTEKPIHTFGDFIANNFEPIFFPQFAWNGGWVAVFQGDPNRYPLVARKEMTYSELDEVSKRDSGESWSKIAEQHAQKRLKELKAMAEAIKETEKNNPNEKHLQEIKQSLAKDIEIYNNFKPDKQKVLVFYTTGKFKIRKATDMNESLQLNEFNLFNRKKKTSENELERGMDKFDTDDSKWKFRLGKKSKEQSAQGDYNPDEIDDENNWEEIELKNEPLFAWNPYILYQADLHKIIKVNLNTTNTQYLMRGLFKNHMQIVAKAEKDKGATKEIRSKVNTIFDSMIKMAANDYGVYHLANLEDETWVPVEEENADKNIKLMGNFTPNELCNVWNKEETAWQYLWVDDEFTDKTIIPTPAPKLLPQNTGTTALTVIKQDENIPDEVIKLLPHSTGTTAVTKAQSTAVAKTDNIPPQVYRLLPQSTAEDITDQATEILPNGEEVALNSKRSEKKNPAMTKQIEAVKQKAEQKQNVYKEQPIKQTPQQKQKTVATVKEIMNDKETEKKTQLMRLNFPEKADRKRFYSDLAKNGKLSKEDYDSFENKFLDGKYYQSVKGKGQDGKKLIPLTDDKVYKILTYVTNVLDKHTTDGVMTADGFKAARKKIADTLYKNQIIVESLGKPSKWRMIFD